MSQEQNPCVSERYKKKSYTAPWQYQKKNIIAEQSLFPVTCGFFKHKEPFSAYFLADNIESEQKLKTALVRG